MMSKAAKRNVFIWIFIGSATLWISACSSWIGKVNIFPVENDVALGQQVAGSIENDPAMVIIDSAQNTKIYQYVYGIRDSILATNLLEHKKDFVWRVRLIKNDTIQNAFCTPGGFIYVYTGLMKYLESEDQLAGVMGHEMAHAEKRHSTDALTREFGVNLLLELIFGTDKAQLLRIATNLAQLSYGRDAETEADNCSVDWLYATSYNPTGAAGFFEKMEKEQKGNIPEFLSTHPNPGNRIQNMKQRWESKGKKSGNTYAERYKTMIKLLN
jgi:predicted Zn-dependent protease